MDQSISHGHVPFAKEGENAPMFDHFDHGGSEMTIVDGAEMTESKTLGLLHQSISHGHVPFAKEGENVPQFDHFGHGSIHGGGEMTIMDGAEMTESKTIGLLNQSISHGHIKFAKEGENAPQFDHFGHGNDWMAIADGAEASKSTSNPSLSHGSYAQIGSELRESGPWRIKAPKRRKKHPPWATMAHVERAALPRKSVSKEGSKKKKKKKKKLPDFRPLHERGIRGKPQVTTSRPVTARAAADVITRAKSSRPVLPALRNQTGSAHQRRLALASAPLSGRLAQKANIEGLRAQPKPLQTYGGGHADKDLADHFVEGVTLGKGGGKSYAEMYGGHYGGTNKDANDSKDHFSIHGEQMGADGALAYAEMYGEHYGGTNKDVNDSIDHFGNGLTMGKGGGKSYVEMYGEHYGGTNKNVNDSKDHFSIHGEQMGADGGLTYAEMYGEHQGGTDETHNDTFSNMGPGLIPNKQPLRINPYTKPTLPPAQVKLVGGYSPEKVLATNPQNRGGSTQRGAMVYPGKDVLRPETLDTATYDNRYTDIDAMLAARQTAPLEERDGMQVLFPGYRTSVVSPSYEMKCSKRGGYMPGARKDRNDLLC